MTSGRRERRRRGRGAANFHEKSTVPRAYIPIRFYINSWARVAALKASAKINIGSILDGLLIKPDTVIAVCSRPSLLLFSPPPSLPLILLPVLAAQESSFPRARETSACLKLKFMCGRSMEHDGTVREEG